MPELYTTLLNDIAKPTIILLICVLFLTLTLYISYIYYSKINKPLYLSKINYDAYENQSVLNQPLANNNNNANASANANNNNNANANNNNNNIIDPKIDITKLQEFSNLQSCPQGICAIKITGNLLGVKRCPATTDGILMYDVTQEQCIQSNLCPSNIPYAQKLNGEALTGVCDPGNDACNCLTSLQCATYVTKYFNNTATGQAGKGSMGLNYAFSTQGQKTNDNFYNPLQINLQDLGKVFCEINPAFVDTIVNGCQLTNHWADPTNCQTYENVIFNSNIPLNITVQNPDSVYTYFNKTNIPKNISNQEYYNNADSLAIIVSGLQTSPPQILPFVGYFFDQKNKETVFKYSGYDQAIININTGINFYILKNISHYDDNEKIFMPGVCGMVAVNDILTFEYFDFTFCNDGAVNGANNKNMLMCVQDYNQPCTEGTLAYNFDRTITSSNNARNFCQAYDQPGVDRLSINSDAQASIQTFYLTDPAYFTQSCVVGNGCGAMIDYTQCVDAGYDCSIAIREKKSRFFPIFDDSAVSNVWQVGPGYIQTNPYGTSITQKSSTEFILNNNLFDPENGDYFQINNSPINDIFIMKTATTGGVSLKLNTTTGLNIGDVLLNPLISGAPITIASISGNGISISEAISASAVSLFNAGTHLIFSSNTVASDYGVVRTNSLNTFEFLDLITLEPQNITIDNITANGIIFYKQFGFNGLNYGTCYNPITFEREFSNSYKYGEYNYFIDPNLRLAETPPFIIDNLISNYSSNVNTISQFNKQVFSSTTANFKQKNSMYYPVWNEDNFKQECVFCSPSLYAIPIISQGGRIAGVDIQFSGKDFYQYIKDVDGYLAPGEYISYLYTMYSLTSTVKTQTSTTAMIYLQNPNIDILPGDYIIDASGVFAVNIYDSNGNKYTGSTAAFNTFENVFSSNINNARPALLPNHLTTSSYNTINLNPQNNTNLFAGKCYYNTPGDLYYVVVPTVQVSSVLQSGSVIMTSTSLIKSIPKNTLLQIIRPNQTLGIGIQGDIDAISQTTAYANQSVYSGAEAEIVVSEITDGRITNISINNQGSNYVITNKPLLFVNQYKTNDNILVVS